MWINSHITILWNSRGGNSSYNLCTSRSKDRQRDWFSFFAQVKRSETYSKWNANCRYETLTSFFFLSWLHHHGRYAQMIDDSPQMRWSQSEKPDWETARIRKYRYCVNEGSKSKKKKKKVAHHVQTFFFYFSWFFFVEFWICGGKLVFLSGLSALPVCSHGCTG